jgi:hypothetical protein
MTTDCKPFKRTANLGLGAVLALLLLAFSCGQAQTVEPTGGETHFLARCTAGSTSCGSGLSCVCGICTRRCDARAACQDLPAAACVAPSSSESCVDSNAAGHCDVACVVDADCAVLSPAHRCESGACRAGLPGSSANDSAGVGGAPELAAGGSASAGETSVCAHGDVAANQVLMIGDSFFASSHQITAYLEDSARRAGALATGERYRDNSRLTENTLALIGHGVTDQYLAGRAEAAVRVVVMNGGGADLLLGSCDTLDASCPLLSDAAAAAGELLAQMATDGVLHVVYAFYPDPVDTGLRAEMDALRPLIQGACEASAVACHWLDLRADFADQYAAYVMPDGINPTAAGSQASARAIWAIMQRNCAAQ